MRAHTQCKSPKNEDLAQNKSPKKEGPAQYKSPKKEGPAQYKGPKNEGPAQYKSPKNEGLAQYKSPKNEGPTQYKSQAGTQFPQEQSLTPSKRTSRVFCSIDGQLWFIWEERMSIRRTVLRHGDEPYAYGAMF